MLFAVRNRLGSQVLFLWLYLPSGRGQQYQAVCSGAPHFAPFHGIHLQARGQPPSTPGNRARPKGLVKQDGEILVVLLAETSPRCRRRRPPRFGLPPWFRWQCWRSRPECNTERSDHRSRLGFRVLPSGRTISSAIAVMGGVSS